jgi:hypothetical protein
VRDAERVAKGRDGAARRADGVATDRQRAASYT